MQTEELKPAKEKNPYNRKAIYIGRRLGRDDRVLQEFLLLPEKTPMFFAKVKRPMIGFTYKCSSSQISTRPERTDDDHIEDPNWEAEDAVVEAHLLKKHHEKRLEKKSSWQIDRCVEQLRPLVKGRGYTELKALVDILIHKALKGM